MTLSTFLRQVEHLCKNMNYKQTTACIHEIARKLPEGKRNDFLELLSLYQGKKINDSGNDTAIDRGTEDDDILQNISVCLNTLKKISEGEAGLESDYNEEYDDWYNSTVNEFLFSDPEGLLSDIDAAITFIHTCVDREIYQAGFQLAQTISSMTVEVLGAYGECVDASMDISELFSNGLLEGSQNALLQESLYLAYMGNELHHRAAVMLDIIDNYGDSSVTLDQVLQIGNHEVPEFEEFLPLWIDEVGRRNGYYTENLLKEAQSMLPDTAQALEIARKYAVTHPELYMQLLLTGSELYEKAENFFQIGLEALDKIPESYQIRGTIALLTADYGWKMNELKRESIEFCWQEAFRSDSSSVNFLRLCLYSTNWNKIKNDIRSIYEKIYRNNSKENDYGRSSIAENRINSNEYCQLLFWDQRFDKAIENGMKPRESLGWSFTFMKDGLADFLLLLYRGNTLPKGLEGMLLLVCSACDFTWKNFISGIDKKSLPLIEDISAKEDTELQKRKDRECLWSLMLNWKSTVKLSDEFQKNMLAKIDAWLSLRVDGIVGNQKRNYYGECAVFLAAYGEVLESLGEKSARFRILNRYKQKFPRHRAFIQELKYFEPNI